MTINETGDICALHVCEYCLRAVTNVVYLFANMLLLKMETLFYVFEKCGLRFFKYALLLQI